MENKQTASNRWADGGAYQSGSAIIEIISRMSVPLGGADVKRGEASALARPITWRRLDLFDVANRRPAIEAPPRASALAASRASNGGGGALWQEMAARARSDRVGSA